MKRLVLPVLIAAAGLLSPPAFAMDHAGHRAAPAAGDSQLAEGTVKKVDKSAGKVTVAHGPLVNLGMPGMTMAFRVKDAAWLDQMKAGDRIRFLVEEVNGAYTVVRYEPAR